MSGSPLFVARERWLGDRCVSGEITGRTRALLAARFRDLEALHGVRPVSALDRRTLTAWARAVGHKAPATRRAYRSTVAAFCRWAVAEGLLAADPTEHLARVREPRRVPRARPAQDVAVLLSSSRSARDRLVVWLMVEMGLRCVEVSRLEVADYDQVAATMLIRGKSAHERVLPVPDAVVAAIDAYRAPIGWAAGPLVCSVRSVHHGIGAHRVSVLVTAMMSAAGIKHRPGDGITPHVLRHTAASDVLDRCGNVRTVQAMLGHQSLATTEIYLRRASLGQLREAMEGRDYGTPA